ncbi:MAG: AIPR family protein [Rhodospirillales bacterium]|nr:AIPR family protein [Rhodospirillales bacterium]
MLLTKVFDKESFERLNSRIEALVDDGLVSTKNSALIFLFLSHRFYKEQFEIEEAYTDGGNDCGIDAIYIDRQSDQPVVHLFQSKVHDSERKARNAFKASAAEKSVRFFEVLKDRDSELDKVVNARLKQKILEIRDLQDRDFPAFKLWLLSNGNECVEHQLRPLVRNLAAQDVDVEQFHMIEFVEFCVDAHSARTSHTFFARDAGVVEFGNSELRSFVGYISARQLYDLIRDLRDERKVDYSLFDMNVRGFLGLNNPVNKEIFKTAASSEKRHFASFNNGITMVGTSCKVMRTATDNPKVGVKRLSIVNGAQTCSAIFDAMKDYFPDFGGFEELSVLFRIFETDDPELISKIAVSTNTQNRILSRDLRVNDERQLKLESDLAKLGVTYVRKRGLLASYSVKGGRILDALRAGQLIMSYKLHDPARAKRDSDSIFSEAYEKIFNSATAEQIVEALEWFELIEEKKQFIEDEIRIRGVARTDDTFVTYGSFHVLMLCGMIGKAAPTSEREQVIEKAIQVIAEALKQAGEPAYYSYFRDPKQADRLKNAIKQFSLF